nr:MAG TPA: hypothetical protein [Caudoviricetes sp.]
MWFYGAKLGRVYSPAKQSVKFLHSIFTRRPFVPILHHKIISNHISKDSVMNGKQGFNG